MNKTDKNPCPHRAYVQIELGNMLDPKTNRLYSISDGDKPFRKEMENAEKVTLKKYERSFNVMFVYCAKELF